MRIRTDISKRLFSIMLGFCMIFSAVAFTAPHLIIGENNHLDHVHAEEEGETETNEYILDVSAYRNGYELNGTTYTWTAGKPPAVPSETTVGGPASPYSGKYFTAPTILAGTKGYFTLANVGNTANRSIDYGSDKPETLASATVSSGMSFNINGATSATNNMINRAIVFSTVPTAQAITVNVWVASAVSSGVDVATRPVNLFKIKNLLDDDNTTEIESLFSETTISTSTTEPTKFSFSLDEPGDYAIGSTGGGNHVYYVEVIEMGEKPEHRWSTLWSTKTAATCTETGEDDRYCEVHYDNIAEARTAYANADAAGKEAMAQDYQVVETKALGHAWSEWSTPDVDGKQERTCTRGGGCTAKENRTVPIVPDTSDLCRKVFYDVAYFDSVNLNSGTPELKYAGQSTGIYYVSRTNSTFDTDTVAVRTFASAGYNREEITTTTPPARLKLNASKTATGADIREASTDETVDYRKNLPDTGYLKFQADKAKQMYIWAVLGGTGNRMLALYKMNAGGTAIESLLDAKLAASTASPISPISFDIPSEGHYAIGVVDNQVNIYMMAFDEHEWEYTEAGSNGYEVISTPTCTDKGLKTRVCEHCPLSESIETDAVGNGFHEWVDDEDGIITEATCGAPGKKTQTCSVCHISRETNYNVAAHKHTVTFMHGSTNLGGGGEVDCGSTIEAPTAPTLGGNTFVGWYKDAACTQEFNFETDTITANTTIYAKFNKNGGCPAGITTPADIGGIGLFASAMLVMLAASMLIKRRRAIKAS